MTPPILSALRLSVRDETGVLSSLALPLPGHDDDHGATGLIASLEQAGRLHPDEAQMARSMSAARRMAFVSGRIALRSAVHAIAPQVSSHPLLPSDRGAPTMPPGVRGSISHKRTRAIAIVMASDSGQLGVDLEHRPRAEDASRPSIARRVLTRHEQDALTSLDPLAHREATLLRFSLKEAIYKALDPVVQRYVRFTEVELDVIDDDRAEVRLLLPELLGESSQIEARWHIDADWIVTTARWWR